ncbi:MAG TPA: leucyl/phenylalanyl-tRNA--protein transferase [Humisphaera sp.]|nr:leucyl/phenylalanyl-tRNA--protein transferase [Humisphaera sp.]
MQLDPQTLLSAYAQGVFPMADRDGQVRFYTADPRGILPLDERFHVSRTLGQLLRKDPPAFQIRINADFDAVMRGCMSNRGDGTWINEKIIRAYTELHEMGFAHSVEAWKNGELVGGLYGVSLGAAFFGESMFHRAPNASKVALVHLVNRLRERGYELLDSQATTSHLRTFGAIEIPAGDYLVRLQSALKRECIFD